MKEHCTCEQAAEEIFDGAVLLIGGFMGVGTSERLIDAIVERGIKDLTVVANDTARPGVGIGKLVDAGLVAKAITSHIGTNPVTQQKMIAGEMEVELVPQGTLAERVRAAGAGLGGVLTATGLGTEAAEGKQTIEVEGKTFIVEPPLGGDFAIVRAKQADYYGNLTYNLTARNFNPLMALAADKCLVDPQEIVPVGCITPDQVVTPGAIVDMLIEREHH